MTAATAPATWRSENASWLAAALRLLRLRLHRRALETRQTGDGRISDWLLAGDDDAPGPPRDRRAIDQVDELIAQGKRTLAERAAAIEAGGRRPALLEMAELAGLSAFETELLLLAAAASLDGAFAAAFAEVHGDTRRDHATLHLALALYVPPEDRLVAADALLPGRMLRLLRLVTVDDPPEDPLLMRRLRVDDRLTDYLRGLNRLDERLDAFLLPLPDAPGANATGDVADATGVAGAIVARVSAASDRWPTVNLVGATDGGARDAAQRACRTLDLRFRRLDLDRLTALDSDRRAAILELCGREAVLAGVALLVDAVGVERGSALAAVVDEVVRTVRAPLFLISRERWSTEATTVDVLAVPRPNRRERRSLWRTALAAYPNSVNGEIDAIVEQFDFGSAAISEVVTRAAADSKDAITGRSLWEACRVQAGPGLDELARRIEPTFGWDDIVVDADVRTQLYELAAQVEGRSQVYETWAFGSQLGRGRGITALFAGPSGTGKTMAAEIIARHLRLDLYRIDLAGVVSKYVGETEKNLRRVFEAAESSGAILLFDEADALFGTRTEVRDSHDRYANLEINYLLQAMEDYSGLAILATNRRTALDGAFLRRLRFIIDFPFPGADDRRQIWERVFPGAAELDGIDHGFLSRLELTGGSIRSIAVNAAFLAASDHGPIRMPHVIRAAAREYGKLSRPISAADFGDWLTVARR